MIRHRKVKTKTSFSLQHQYCFVIYELICIHIHCKNERFVMLLFAVETTNYAGVCPTCKRDEQTIAWRVLKTTMRDIVSVYFLLYNMYITSNVCLMLKPVGGK